MHFNVIIMSGGEDRMPHDHMAERSPGRTGALLMKRKMLALDAFQSHLIEKVEILTSI